MKVAVTGGTGFIGSHVVDALVAADHEVVVIDLRRPHRDDVAHQAVDIGDLDGLVRATAGCEAVFHLAAFADVNDVAADPIGAIDSNVVGTGKVWEACRRNGVRRAILASTVWVYGSAADGEGDLDETAVFDLGRAGHLYTSSKIAAELVAHSYQELYDLDFTILRYGIPYGPRMRPALVIPKFVSMALAGDPITVHGDGSQFRNYVYVEDLARAHVLALGDVAANQVVNLEGSERVTIRRLVDSIATALECPVDVAYSDARTGDYEGREISAAHAEALLGWRPTVAFEEGLRRYVDWHLAVEAAPAVAPEPVVAPVPVPATVPAPVAAATTAGSSGWRSVAAGCLTGTLALPVLAVAQHGTSTDNIVGLLAAFGGLAVFGLVRARRRPVALVPFPVSLVVAMAAIWLISQAPFSWELVPLTVLLAAVSAQMSPDPWRTRSALSAGLATAAALTLVQAARPSSTWWVAAGAVAVAAAAVSLRRPASVLPLTPARRVRWSLATLTVTCVLGSWVGATSATASWFGTLVSHGPREGTQVALTFDRSSAPEAQSVLRILNAHHVQATFFTSGTDLRADPSGARQLMNAGQLLGDADYSRRPGLLIDTTPGLLTRSQRAFSDLLGVCPTYVRPPRGTHTPLTARLAHQRSATLVTWDVGRFSGGHYDGARLANAVLSSVRPGSIVDLSFASGRHKPGAVAEALPLILDGLQARHLQPVRLDALLGGAGYAGRC